MGTLEHKQIKELHDKAYEANTDTRDEASSDLVFFHVTQWDDTLLDQSTLQYRGEFDVIKKGARDIISQLRLNEVQVDFKPEDSQREDASEILDGIYRSEANKNSSQESFNVARAEKVICGVGHWELIQKYETTLLGDDRQKIERRPINESVNKVFWDPNAKRIDKSDAKYCSVLEMYSSDAYDDLCEEYGVEPCSPNSFAQPNESFSFPWYSKNEIIYVARFYHSEKAIEKNITLADPMGGEIVMRDFEMKKIEDDLIEAGFEIIGEKKVKRNKVTLYIVSGDQVIHSQRIAGECIPIVPDYGERGYVEGVEVYYGCVRGAKDPQRLRNFQMSYLADIASKSPRRKPIYLPEQIKGYEYMYEESGADNDYPYVLQQRVDSQGRDLPLGQVGETLDPTVPPALATLFQLSTEAINDVINPALPQSISDPDLSGKAVHALQSMLDRQNYVYQDNHKFALRRDGEIFASMASEIFDTPREVSVRKPDGSESTAMVMQEVFTEDGELATINDLTGIRFEVSADIGRSYDSQREQTIEQLGEIALEIRDSDPSLYKIIMLKRLQLMEGVDLKDIKSYVSDQLLLAGWREPESEEDMMKLQQAAQQQNQPDPVAQAAMMEGQARMMEGQAAMQNEVNDANKITIDQFKAETDRMKVMIDAEKTGVDIENKNVDTQGKQLDNAAKMANLFRGSATQA